MDMIQDHLFGQAKTRALTEQEMMEQCADIEAVSQTPQAASAMVPQALALVRAAPKDHRPQLLAAKLMERRRQKENMLDTWTGLHDRFPDLHIALRYMVRWLNRDNQIADAVELLCTMIDCNVDTHDTVDMAKSACLRPPAMWWTAAISPMMP